MCNRSWLLMVSSLAVIGLIRALSIDNQLMVIKNGEYNIIVKNFTKKIISIVNIGNLGINLCNSYKKIGELLSNCFWRTMKMFCNFQLI